MMLENTTVPFMMESKSYMPKRSGGYLGGTRSQILELLKEEEMSIADMALEIGIKLAPVGKRITHSTTSYHLDMLIRKRLVFSRVDGNKSYHSLVGKEYQTRVVPKKIVNGPVPERITPVPMTTGVYRIFNALKEDGWLTRAEISRRADLSGPAVVFNLRRLDAFDLIQEERNGRNRYISLKDDFELDDETRVWLRGSPVNYKPADVDVRIQSKGLA